MNYIDLIRKFWQLDATWQFGCCESRLYFYLVEQANRLGWPDSFTHSDRRLSENVGASRNAIIRAKNRLAQAGLLQVIMGGRGKGNRTSYSFVEKPESESTSDQFGLNINQSRSQTRNQSRSQTRNQSRSQNVDDTSYIEDKQNKTILTSNEVVELWNSTCSNFPKIVKLSDQRKKKIKIRLREFGNNRAEQLQTIEAIFRNMQASKFLQGDNDRKWSATFDWLFGSDTNWVKVIEGNYKKSTTNVRSTTNQPPSADELARAVADGIARANTRQEWE